MKPTLIIFLSFALMHSANAQLSIDAQVRNRFEARDGYQKLAPSDAVPAAFMFQRTRLAFAYNSDNLKLYITPQDARVWGDEKLASSTGVYGDDASLTLFEGYAEIKLTNKNNTWLSVGRQQLIYDSQRLLSARNWNINGIAYDAAILKMNIEKWDLHLAGSWNSASASSSNIHYPSNRIKSLNFVWLNRNISNDFNVSFMHLASGVTPADTTNQINFRQTTGVYTKYKKNNFQAWGNAYFQYGKNKTGQNISAVLIDADAGYSIGVFTPGLGFSYLSGNSKIGNNTDKLFDVHYGTRHGYFGFIDYFCNIPADTKQGGLMDYYFYLRFKFKNGFSINNTGHYFALAQTNELTPLNKALGYESDLVLNYRFNKWGNLELGYMFMLPTESLKTMHGITDSNFSQFLYLQLTIITSLIK